MALMPRIHAQLQIKFPIMLEDLTKAAQEFECHSSHGIMNGCVAALDG
jgi:hypothetical protein